MKAGGALVTLMMAALASVSEAVAQVPIATHPAFSVERFAPVPGGGSFLGVEPADVLADGRWAISLSTWLAERPIVLRFVQTGVEESVPVRWRWGQALAVARGFGARTQIGFVLPTAAQWGDRLQGIGLSETPLANLVVGDLRLHGRVRIVGRSETPGLAVAVAAAIELPTGDDDQFAGEAGWTLAGGVRVGWRSHDLEFGGGVGRRFRSQPVVLLSPARRHGDEWTLGVAAAIRVALLGRAFGGHDRGWVLAEIESVVGASPETGVRGPSPAEARLGVRVHVHHCWSVAIAAGAGLSPDEIGSPEWRALTQITFDQSPARDRDRDGVADGSDACWREPEDRDGRDDWDGCPDLDDDGDGVLDADDQCPRVAEDRDGYRDTDGCPDNEARMPSK